MELEVTFDPESLDELTEAILKDLKDRDLLEPVTITCEAPEAVWVEFGTRPASGARSQGGPEDVKKKLSDWAEKKKGIEDPAERKRFVNAVYHKIMKEGQRPMPFFRPAIYDISDVLDVMSDQYLSKADPMMEIAKDMRDQMRHYLQANDSIYTGKISDEIEITRGEGRGDGQLEGVTEDMWRSRQLGHDGHIPDMRRWRGEGVGQ